MFTTCGERRRVERRRVEEEARGRSGPDVLVEVPSRGESNFEEQDASWGEGEREDGKEGRGGGGEGCWEGGRGVGRSRTGV
jgi:hypothetical protein